MNGLWFKGTYCALAITHATNGDGQGEAAHPVPDQHQIDGGDHKNDSSSDSTRAPRKLGPPVSVHNQ